MGNDVLKETDSVVHKIKQRIDVATLKMALKTTTPVLFGYLAIGIAFGLLLYNAGYSWVVAMIMGIAIYAGAVQYLAVGLFANNASLVEVATIVLLVNFRHMVYGLSLFDKFNLTGKLKPYMIFSLTDETYALLTSVKVPEGVNVGRFYFYIAFLNQSYWVVGSIIGAMAGRFINIDSKGLEFALTALFIVLLLEQYENYKTKLPFLIGATGAVATVFLLGKEHMLLGSVILSMVLLVIMKERITKNESN